MVTFASRQYENGPFFWFFITLQVHALHQAEKHDFPGNILSPDSMSSLAPDTAPVPQIRTLESFDWEL